MNELLQVAIKAARSAGDEIIKHYNNYELEYKSDNSPLTSADLAANEALFFWLSKTGISICSEENILPYEQRGENSTFWLVDPLDGTKQFIKKNGEFCVCVALIENGVPRMSVIYIPVSREIFYSSGNSMVYKNDVLLKTSNDGDNILISNSSLKDDLNVQKMITNFNLEHVTCGSAVKFCRLVEGSAGMYIRKKACNIWDIAAGDYLVRQSGGVLLNLDTNSIFNYNVENYLMNGNFIALNKNLFKNLNDYLSFLM